MSNWQFKKLGDLTSKIGSGATPRGGQSNYVDTGVSFIRSQNILDHAMKITDIAHITDDAAHKLRGVTVKAGDVLINITGDSIARCSIVDDNVLPARVNQHVAILRTTPDLNPRFLQKFLVSPTMKKHLINISSGGTRKALTRADLSSLSIPVPPIQEQQAIAEVLGALDDKITANNKLAMTLSEMAEAQYLSSSSSCEIFSPLRDLVTTQYGVTTSSHDHPGPRLIRVTDINKKPWIEWETAPHCTLGEKDWEKYKVSAGDILVARMADPGKAAYVDIDHPDAVFASYLVRLRAIDASQALYIYYFLKSPAYRAYSLGAMQGSVQKNMNAKVIVDTKIPVPSENSVQEFNALVAPFRNQIQQTRQENISLSAVRDTLLPQLMSGKIRVREAESIVEDVL